MQSHPSRNTVRGKHSTRKVTSTASTTRNRSNRPIQVLRFVEETTRTPSKMATWSCNKKYTESERSFDWSLKKTMLNNKIWFTSLNKWKLFFFFGTINRLYVYLYNINILPPKMSMDLISRLLSCTLYTRVRGIRLPTPWLHLWPYILFVHFIDSHLLGEDVNVRFSTTKKKWWLYFVFYESNRDRGHGAGKLSLFSFWCVYVYIL